MLIIISYFFDDFPFPGRLFLIITIKKQLIQKNVDWLDIF